MTRFSSSLGLALALSLPVGPSARAGTTIHVDAQNPNCPGSGSESDPFCRIQDAIQAAPSGSTILVRPGTYVENVDFLGKAVTVKAVGGADVTVIDGNQSGGAVVTFQRGEGQSSVLDGFRITGGIAGGVLCVSSSPTIRGNTITGNQALGYTGGGGVTCSLISSPTILNNTITQNSSAYYAGGIACVLYSSPTITNNTIHANSTSGPLDGGGIGCRAFSYPMLTNNTVTANSSQGQGGGISSRGSFPTVANCVLWGNSPGQIYPNGQLVVSYSLVQGSYPGTGNLGLDPLFLDPASGDFRLDCGSPCIDAGQNSVLGVSMPPDDFEGDRRIVDGDSDGVATIDIGADEFDALWRLDRPAAAGTSVSFTAKVPPARIGEVAFVFLSRGDGRTTGGILVPGSGGLRLLLDWDATFVAWLLQVPTRMRGVVLGPCPGATTVSLAIPASTPVGVRYHYAGIVMGSGFVTAVTPTRSLVTQ